MTCISPSIASSTTAPTIILANIIVGAVVDEAMEGEIQVTVIATGFETNQPLKQQRIKNRLANQPLYNMSENKDSGASIPEFLRLRQNKKDID